MFFELDAFSYTLAIKFFLVAFLP